MHSLEEPGRPPHPSHAVPPGPMPLVPGRERVRHRPGPDPVPVLPGSGAPPSVEPCRGASRTYHNHLRSQLPVHCPLDPLRLTVRLERDHLALGVDPGVGPPRHREAWRRPQDPPQGFLQDALDGPLSRLAGEPSEVGPVVRQNQPEDPYSSSRRPTSSMMAIGAPSPCRGPTFRIRV